MSDPIRVILADDHTLVRDTLRQWLNNAGDIAVVAETPTAEAAIDEAIRHKPDVVLMDIDMPGLLCFDAARTIRARSPETKIVFLSAFFHDRYIEDALSAEASGYLTKSEPPEEVVRAIREVAAGGICFSPEVRSRIVIDAHGARLSAEPRTRAGTLTPREVEVLRYIARGLSKKDIAGTMHISVKTVDNHCTNLMNKLDIHDRVSLARFAIREGLAEA